MRFFTRSPTPLSAPVLPGDRTAPGYPQAEAMSRHAAVALSRIQQRSGHMIFTCKCTGQNGLKGQK